MRTFIETVSAIDWSAVLFGLMVTVVVTVGLIKLMIVFARTPKFKPAGILAVAIPVEMYLFVMVKAILRLRELGFHDQVHLGVLSIVLATVGYVSVVFIYNLMVVVFRTYMEIDRGQR